MSPRKQHRVEITLSDERLRALDEARGNEARASFIKRAMDEAIGASKRVPAVGQRMPWGLGPRLNVSAKPAVKPRPKGKR